MFQNININWILKILRESTRQLPQLQYAWGLLGVSAVGAIIIGVLGSSKASVIIISLVVIGMVILFVVTVAFKNEKISRIPAQILLWSVTLFVIIFMSFTVSAFSLSWPCPWVIFLDVPNTTCGKPGPILSENERLIIEVKNEIDQLAQLLEARYQYQDGSEAKITAVNTVREKSVSLGNRMLSIASENIRPIYDAIKYEYVSYAYIMAAYVGKDKDFILNIAGKAILNGLQSLKIIDEILGDFKVGNSSLEKQVRYIHEDDIKNRINYLISMGYALKIFYKRIDKLSELGRHWNNVSPYFRDKFPITDPRMAEVVNRL